MRGSRDEALNVLYDAALEFGENWRRAVTDLAAERLPLWAEAEREALVAEVEACRGAVENRIERRWGEGPWTPAASQEVREWISTEYPWVSDDNAAHALSQGLYYAWHG